MQVYSFEEADGAIATAEQHIVQEQSHIIETLNRKLAQMKEELNIDGKKIEDLEKEKSDLKMEMAKEKDLLERTRQTALSNQEVLKKSIGKWKQKEHSEHESLIKEKTAQEKLRQEILAVQSLATRNSNDAKEAHRQYEELLEQKRTAIKRAGEIKEAKTKRVKEAFLKNKQPEDGGLYPKFLSTQRKTSVAGVRNMHFKHGEQERRQSTIQGRYSKKANRPTSWGSSGPDVADERFGGESLF